MFKESQFFPPGFYTSFKYIQTSVYWLLQVFLIYKIVKKNAAIFKGENSVWIKWLLVFILSESFLFLPPMALLNSQYFYNPWVVFFYVGGGTGLTAIFIFFFPRILYGLQGVELINSWDLFYKKNRKEDGILKSQPYAFETSKNIVLNADLIERDGMISKIEPQKTSFAQFLNGKIYSIQPGKFSYVLIKEKQNPTYYLSKRRKMEILAVIRNHFSENKPYLILHYTQQQLAAELNIPTQYISTVINEFEKVNFNDFVNNYRVQHCIELLQHDEHRFHTLEYIATKCGFNNRNTFTIAFRKVVGQTPSSYIKSLSDR